MKKAFLFLTLSSIALSIVAQKQQGFLQVANQKMFFEFNDVTDDASNKLYYLNFLYDSQCLFKRPHACFLHDTIMEINPVTLEEKMIFSTDSIVVAKFNLGIISKRDLDIAVSAQMNLSKNGLNLRLKGLTLAIFKADCELITIDYSKPNEMELARQRIQKLASGSTIVLTGLDFQNVKGRTFNKSYDYLAIAQIKE